MILKQKQLKKNVDSGYTFREIRNGFTFLELLLTISIIAILASLLQPFLYKARERAKYTKWLVFTNNLRNDPSLIGQWMFENHDFVQYKHTSNNSIVNGAQGLSEPNYSSKVLDGQMIECSKSRKGRWNKGAVYLSGNPNSYIIINDGKIYNPDKDDMTILIWFKPTTKNTRFIMCKGNSENKDSGWSFYHNSKLYMRAHSVDKQTFSNKQKEKMVSDKWYLAALVINNSEKLVKMYIDGEEVCSKNMNVKPQKDESSQEQPIEFAATETYTLIGRRASAGAYFRGYIDEIDIFRRALSEKEIKDFYEIGSDVHIKKLIFQYYRNIFE